MTPYEHEKFQVLLRRAKRAKAQTRLYRDFNIRLRHLVGLKEGDGVSLLGVIKAMQQVVVEAGHLKLLPGHDHYRLHAALIDLKRAYSAPCKHGGGT